MAEEATISSPSGIPVEPVSEKLVPQSEVNRLVGGAKKEQYDKGYNDAYQKAKAEMPVPTVAPVVDDALIEKKITELVAKKQQEQTKAANELAFAQLRSEVGEKVSEAAQRIPDYNQVIADAGLADGNSQINGAITYYGNMVDNSGDVFYELGKSVSKLASLTALITSGNEVAAKNYIREISAAIKSNKNSDFKVPNSPLSTIKPSAIGADGSNENAHLKAMRAATMKYKV